MARSRKTFEVDMFKAGVNECLAHKEYTNAEKQVMCMLLEGVLHKTGNYKGYNNLYWLNGGNALWIMEGQPEGEAKNRYISNNGLDEYSRLYY